MARTCIICGGRAGSREHIFPAALGGRRVNKGIYCGYHNTGFSPLAAVLAEQLAAINALLGVRPDHSDLPRKFTIVNPSDGQEYLMSALTMELPAARVLKDTVENGIRQVQAIFSNDRQRQSWMSEQNAVGMRLETTKIINVMRFFTNAYPIRLSLGGAEALRAIGYVSLTFLAHYFPAIARKANFKPFKEFVLGANTSSPVAWDFSDLPDDFPHNTFRFGHRIVVTTSALRNEACVRISLFSTLHFAVNFGSVEINEGKTVIIDVDPQAERQQGDIKETILYETLLRADILSPKAAGLDETIESGKAQQLFQRLMQRIGDWQQESIAASLLLEIKSSVSATAFERTDLVRRLLGERAQCVLNLMLHIRNQAEVNLKGTPGGVFVIPMLGSLVSGDVDSLTGISQPTSVMLSLAVMALADRICKDYEEENLDLHRLRMILFGGLGCAIVARVVFRPILTQLGIDPDQLA
jgi:hypothetical protein